MFVAGRQADRKGEQASCVVAISARRNHIRL